jgi:hypothetical protein
MFPPPVWLAGRRTLTPSLHFHRGTRQRSSVFYAEKQSFLNNGRNKKRMSYLQILGDSFFAGHCTIGGSNKVWAACLAIQLEEGQHPPAAVEAAAEVVYLCVYGPHGGNLRVEPPQQLPMGSASKLYQKKMSEKKGKGYVPVRFADFLPSFGRPLGSSLVLSEGTDPENVGSSGNRSNGTNSASGSTLEYTAVPVKAVTWERLQQLLADQNWGVAEKVNGERCLCVFDGQELTAYNRKGQRMSAPPEGAHHLKRLGQPFVVDGERMTGELAGHYVIFDLMEWKGEAYTLYPYVLRITTLEQAMLKAGLLTEDRSMPTFLLARANSAANKLSLLVSASGAVMAQRAVESIQACNGEGVVVRNLQGDYFHPPLKFKFVADLDAFVIAVNDGLGGGSLKLGVVRTSDRRVVEVANVRAGLSATDLDVVRRMLADGKRPVFTVTYLPKRTVGIQLVEPRTNLSLMRDDKDPSECTTDQFGPEKAMLIAQADAVL